jgi:acyl-CoA reductase-like NAD-dependent aldehyde dehydrogenase
MTIVTTILSNRFRLHNWSLSTRSTFSVQYNIVFDLHSLQQSCFPKQQQLQQQHTLTSYSKCKSFIRLSSSNSTTKINDISFLEKIPRPRTSHIFGNWIGGTIVHSSTLGDDFVPFTIQQPSSKEIVATSTQYPEDIQSNNHVISVAKNGFEQYKYTSWEDRACILDRFESLLVLAQDVLVDWIVAEVSKPKRLAQIEVSRAISLTRLYAKQTRQQQQQHMIDNENTSFTHFESGRYATQTLRPKGPVFAITPFNFPLNLLLHKFLPAIAAGTSIVVKPTPYAPVIAYIVGLLAKEAGYNAFSIVNLTKTSVIQYITCPTFSTFTFTGGAIGWDLAKQLPVSTKPILELGSNAAIIVNDISSMEQLHTLCNSIVQSAYGFSGQSCISTQRVLVHTSIANILQQRLIDILSTIKQGIPEDNDVWLSSMISPSATVATVQKVQEAKRAGAIVITPTGEDNDNDEKTLITKDGWVKPLIMLNTKPDMDVNCTELFAPILTITVYDTIDEAIALVNTSNLGIHTSIVTMSPKVISQCQQQLHVRGIVVNDVPSIREDYLPYGGVGLSGIGYEGVATGIEDYSESTYMIYPPT